MFLTRYRKRVLDAQTPRARAGQMPRDRLDVSENAINKVNSNTFKDFREALECMADEDYWPTFERLFKKHYDETWDNIRIIRGRMQKIER